MEQDNAISVPDLQLQGEFTCTASPVRASGTVAQHAFYFRARHDSWSFAVALRPEVDPVDIDFPEQGFIREGSYGSARRSDASYMPLEEARRIIAECAREFFRDHAA